MKTKTYTVFFLSLLLFLCSGCSFSLPGLGSSTDHNTIKIAALNTSESQIIAGIVQGMIEHYTDKNVEIVNNLATSTVAHQAMLNGDVEISASRYTGTDLTGALQLPPETDPQQALHTVQVEFQKRFQQTWFPSYGFANSYAFMVSKETAEKYNLQKISDLRDVAGDLTAGVDTSWMNREGDGYSEFKVSYGIDFGRVYPMQIGLVYDAVSAGKMDVVLGYSTDGRIASYDLVVLEDDLHFFPPYDCSPVATDKILQEVPELTTIFEKLAGKIDTKTMQQLNYKADDELIEPAVVAQRFLEEHRYFEEKGGN